MSLSMKRNSKEIYVVIAYRWGDRANYSYTLGAFDTKDAAVKCAESHVNFRGGKYDCVVEKCILNQFENNWDNYTEEIHWAKANRTRCFMSILDRIRSIEFDRNRKKVLGIKSAVLWAHSKDNNGSYPLLYISKPKHISQEDYDFMLDRLDINIRK